MSRGKNFNAAEKHFEKKRLLMQKEIDKYKQIAIESSKECETLRNKTDDLELEIINLKDWIERLLEYTNLSKEDIKRVCESEKRKDELLKSWVTFINGAKIFRR